jgi:hypothetical protein
MIKYVVHATPYFATNLIKEKRSQIFVDVAKEGVNHSKTHVMCVVSCIFNY